MNTVDAILDMLLKIAVIAMITLAAISALNQLSGITAKLDRIEQKQCAEVKDESK